MLMCCLPNCAEIDARIFMNEKISHFDHLSPWNVRIGM